MADSDNPWANGANQTYGPWAAQPKPYAPPEPQEAAPMRVQQQPQQDFSFSAFAKQTNYEGLSIDEQAKLHQKYRSEILPMVAQVHGGRVSNWQKEFDAAVPPPVKAKRSGVELFTDPLVGLAAGVTGLAKSATDFVDPSSRASKFLGEVSEGIRGNYSAVEKDAERVRAGDQRRIDADTSMGGIQKFGAEAKSALKNMSVGQLAELVGNILPTLGLTGGVGLAARGLKAGTKGVQAATMGAGAVTGAVGAGGDAAGSAYEAVMNMPAEKLMQTPEYQELVSRLGEAKARETLAMGAARTAQVPGTALGALFGPLGAEAAIGKRLAGQKAGGRFATAGKEAFLSEVPEEVGTTASGNYGVQQVDPRQRLMQGTGQAAVLAAIGGGGAGFIAGGGKAQTQQTLEDQLLDGQAPQTQPAGQQSGTLTIGYDQSSNAGGFKSDTLAGGAGSMVGAGVPGFSPEQAIAEAATMGGALGGRIAENNLRFLDSAWRTGGEDKVRELAQQSNTIGVAARRFIQALDASRVPRQLGAPDQVLALPSPEDPSGMMVAGSDGVSIASNRQAQEMRRDAELWRQKQQETGLTNDVIQAQANRAASQETQGAEGAQENKSAVSGRGAEAGAGVGQLGNVGADGQTLKSVVLQNRDREGVASIAQMQQIASNPDYNRVSISRQLGEGSPVVIDEVNLPDAQRGREEVAVDGQGRSIRTRYAVVEAKDLLASHTADGQAVKGYERGEGGKLRAVAGNGRVAGIQRAYTNGNATSYRTAMQFDQQHGVDPQVIAGMNSPVLVRTMSPVDVTPDIGDRTNTTGVSQLSPVEQAKNDARRVDVAGIEFDDNGDPTPDSVRRFVQGMPESERGSLMDANGRYGRQAVDRLMAAVFWKAYGDADLVQLYAQATDPEAKTVLNALADVAGPMLQLDGMAVDIRDLVTEAAKAAVNARRKGLKLADFASTRDMTMTADTQAVVDFFAQNIRSAKRIGEGLRAAAQFALDNQGGSDMFGDVAPASRADVIKQLRGQDDTRTTKSNADAGRAGPAQVDAGRDGGADSANQQGAGAGPKADSGQGQDLNALFDEALTAATPNKPASAGFSLPDNQEKDNGTQTQKTQQATSGRQEEAAAPAVGRIYKDGELLGADELLAYFDQEIAGKDKGVRVQNPRFEIGRIDEATAKEVAIYIDGYEGQQKRLRVSGRTLKHVQESRPSIAREIVEQLPGMFTNPDEVLPDHKHPHKRALLVKEKKPEPVKPEKNSHVATIEVEIEVEINDGFIDIVTIMTAPDRSLKAARELKKSWLEGQHHAEQATHSPHPLPDKSVSPEADFPDAQPAKQSVPQPPAKAQGPAMVALQKQKAKRDAEAGLNNPASSSPVTDKGETKTVRIYKTQGGKVGAEVLESTDRDGRTTYRYIGEWGAGGGLQFSDMLKTENEWKKTKRGYTVEDVSNSGAPRQPTWGEFEGVQVLRIFGSNFVAVPSNGTTNAAKYDVIDIRNRSEIVAQVASKEIRGWLIKANASEADVLTSPTREQIRATEEAKAAAVRAEKAAKAADDARAKLEQERKEITQRSEAAADTFELGQDPMANLTGQGDVFADSPASDLGERWTRMTQVDREGLALRAGMREPAARRVSGTAWSKMDSVVQERLSKADVSPKPAKNDTTEKRVDETSNSPAIDTSLQTMFEGLNGRGLKKTNAQKKLAKAGADAQYVQERWLDILQDLEDRGVLKINCK